MSGRYRVIWTEVALHDLELIIDFMVDNDDLIDAEKTYAKIRDAVSRLTTLPSRGRVVPELRAEGLDM